MVGKLLPVVKGMATYVLPPRFYNRRLGGTVSARYCYSVFLRHLRLLSEAGGDTNPARVAELGPGASVGIGLAALIAGAERYDGLDVKSYDIDEPSREIFEELAALFDRRAPVPDENEFPDVKPRLPDYAFPDDILTDARLRRALDPERLDRLRRALRGEQSPDTPIIRYIVPWTNSALVEPGAIDWIFSQAVMEHVDDLAASYACCARWLKPGGMMTHQIDFRSHGTTTDWNGHWALSDLTWRLMRGRRPYLINRQPLSTHLREMARSGFEIDTQKTVRTETGVSRDALSARFRDLSEDDFATSGAFIVAHKEAGSAPVH